MAAKQIQQVPYYLICPVCCEIYKMPKSLPCYHSFCEQCLAKLQEDSKVKCPTCSKTSIAPAGGVTELPSNFFIDRIVAEIALAEKVTGKEDVNCDICVRSDLALFSALIAVHFFVIIARSPTSTAENIKAII